MPHSDTTVGWQIERFADNVSRLESVDRKVSSEFRRHQPRSRGARYAEQDANACCQDDVQRSSRWNRTCSSAQLQVCEDARGQPRNQFKLRTVPITCVFIPDAAAYPPKVAVGQLTARGQITATVVRISGIAVAIWGLRRYNERMTDIRFKTESQRERRRLLVC